MTDHTADFSAATQPVLTAESCPSVLTAEPCHWIARGGNPWLAFPQRFRNRRAMAFRRPAFSSLSSSIAHGIATANESMPRLRRSRKFGGIHSRGLHPWLSNTIALRFRSKFGRLNTIALRFRSKFGRLNTIALRFRSKFGRLKLIALRCITNDKGPMTND